MITKEEILLNVLNRYGNIADVKNEFSNIQLEVIYKAMAENARIVNGLVIEDKLALHKQNVSDLLIAWEQFKKANWYESEAVDVEKMLMGKFQAIYGR